jgi:ABC-type nitrate/sulfonate/bicarbonate transport system permease component
MRRLTALFAAAAVALGAAACGNNNDTTPITTPTPVTTTDSFAGTLKQNGGVTHTFLTARGGNVTATLVSLGPDSGLTVGLSLGIWNGNACSAQIAKDNAVQTSYVLGTASGAGTLCVRLYDVGNIVDPVAYQIDVVHP